MYDLLTEVLRYSHWSRYNTFDLNQHRYKEVIDSLHHLCNNIEPGTNTRHSVSTDYIEVTSIVLQLQLLYVHSDLLLQ